MKFPIQQSDQRVVIHLGQQDNGRTVNGATGQRGTRCSR